MGLAGDTRGRRTHAAAIRKQEKLLDMSDPGFGASRVPQRMVVLEDCEEAASARWRTGTKVDAASPFLTP